jgi:hypothetical protein
VRQKRIPEGEMQLVPVRQRVRDRALADGIEEVEQDLVGDE